MRRGPIRPAAALAGVLLGCPMVAGAQARITREAQAGVVVATAEPVEVTGGGGIAARVGRRDRLAASAGAGVAEGEAAFRMEATYHYLLSPGSARAGLYAGGGVAVTRAAVWRGLLVGLVGVEGTPGRRGGWYVEAGFGGGARFAGGYRWRW